MQTILKHVKYYSNTWRLQTICFVILLLYAMLIIYLKSQRNGSQAPTRNALRPRAQITAEVRGRGLGNVMFNYASLLGIAERNGLQIVLPADVPLYPIFKTNISHWQIDIGSMTVLDYTEYKKKAGTYDHRTESFNLCPGKTIIRLNGYYQSWKYFDNIEDKLRAHFSFRSHIENAAQEYLNTIIPSTMQQPQYTKIGVHVRLGDMLKDYNINKGYTVADTDYLKRAMGFFRNEYEHVIFIVCSDSIDWCMQNIKGDDVIFSESKDYTIDLAILASCDHTIITVGTFGWWAAWLANGTTIYFKDWPRPNSFIDRMVTKTDYFKPNWIPM